MRLRSVTLRSPATHAAGSATTPDSPDLRLRGLTSGALLGGLGLAVFWKQRRATPVVTGMLVSLAVMTAIQLLPTLASTKEVWMRIVGTEIFWPWYTLIGVIVTVTVAWTTQRLLDSAASQQATKSETRDSKSGDSSVPK